MGMKKISEEDEKSVVLLLRKWQGLEQLTWESLRIAIVASAIAPGRAWSRQSLSVNEAIRTAFLVAKQRLKLAGGGMATMSDSDALRQLEDLKTEHRELEIRYGALLVRHTKLAYNASLLEGGSFLLDPLPDNTSSQKG